MIDMVEWGKENVLSLLVMEKALEGLINLKICVRLQYVEVMGCGLLNFIFIII